MELCRSERQRRAPRVPDRKAGMSLRIDDYWERDGFTGDECGVIPAREDAGGREESSGGLDGPALVIYQRSLERSAA